MARSTGIGGVFLRSPDPDRLQDWYRRHLGLAPDDSGATIIWWADDPQPDAGGATVWSAFPQESDYFGDPAQAAMINYRVDDIDALVDQLTQAGVEVLPKREDSPYGRFAWAVDCDGNRFELWQPPTLPGRSGPA